MQQFSLLVFYSQLLHFLLCIAWYGFYMGSFVVIKTMTNNLRPVILCLALLSLMSLPVGRHHGDHIISRESEVSRERVWGTIYMTYEVKYNNCYCRWSKVSRLRRRISSLYDFGTGLFQLPFHLLGSCFCLIKWMIVMIQSILLKQS